MLFRCEVIVRARTPSCRPTSRAVRPSAAATRTDRSRWVSTGVAATWLSIPSTIPPSAPRGRPPSTTSPAPARRRETGEPHDARVDRQAGGDLEGLFRLRRLPDDLDVGLGLEHHPQARPDYAEGLQGHDTDPPGPAAPGGGYLR